MKKSFNTKALTVMLVSVAVVGIIGGILFIKKNESAEEIGKLSDEFIEEYLDGYTNMSKKGKPENVLIVVSSKRPQGYGAIDVVEGPRHTYFLMYNSTEMRDKAFSEFEKDSDVMVEKNIKMELAEYKSWGVPEIGLDEAREKIGHNGAPTKIAVIDTGLNVSLFRQNFPDTDLAVYDVENDSEEEDGMIDAIGHGTHVTGIATEGAPMNVSILAIKVSKGESKDIYSSDVVTGMYKAVHDGADVINLSLGATERSSSQEAAINYAKEQDVIVVAAAGNESSSETVYPAGYENTLSISAVNSDLSFASYSNYGDTIDFAAPGTLVTSINGVSSGTSMATPHAAAVVATLKSVNKYLSFDNVRTLLVRRARDLGEPGKDEQFGFGLLDLNEADYCLNSSHCDEYGVFVMENHDVEFGDMTDGTVLAETFDNEVRVTSEQACVFIVSYDGGETYTQVPAIKVEGVENVYEFELENTDGAEAMLAFKGDGDLDGEVSSGDSNLINRSLISSTLKPYRELSNLEKALMDIDGDGVISSADSNLINRSLISSGAPAYREIKW